MKHIFDPYSLYKNINNTSIKGLFRQALSLFKACRITYHNTNDYKSSHIKISGKKLETGIIWEHCLFYQENCQNYIYLDRIFHLDDELLLWELKNWRGFGIPDQRIWIYNETREGFVVSTEGAIGLDKSDFIAIPDWNIACHLFKIFPTLEDSWLPNLEFCPDKHLS